jgi:hypothetical protein
MINVPDEASRIVRNMTQMAEYHGTTSVDVVDEILSRFSNPIFCWGQARNMVFTPITTRHMAFKTEAA